MKKNLWAISFFAMLGACASATTNEVIVELVEQSRQCRAQTAGIEWLSSASSINAAMRPFQLGGSQTADAYDFDNYRYLLVSAGSKPTNGYRFTLNKPMATVDNNGVRLPLTLQTPPAGRAQLQVLTSPCALLRFEREASASISEEARFFLSP